MKKLFDKLEAFLKDAEAQAKGAAKKGADILRGLADWLEEQTNGTLFGAKPKASDLDDLQKLERYCEKLKEIQPVVDQEVNRPTIGATKKPKGAMGPGLQILIQVMLAALQAILEKRKQQEANSPTTPE